MKTISIYFSIIVFNLLAYSAQGDETKLYYYPSTMTFQSFEKCELHLDTAAQNFYNLTRVEALLSFCAKHDTGNAYSLVLGTRDKLPKDYSTRNLEEISFVFKTVQANKTVTLMVYNRQQNVLQKEVRNVSTTLKVMEKINVTNEHKCLISLKKLVDFEYRNQTLFSFCRLDEKNASIWKYHIQFQSYN